MHNHPNRTPEAVTEKVLHLRREYHLGPIRIVQQDQVCQILTARVQREGAPCSPTPQPISPPANHRASAAFDQALMARSSAALIMFLIHHSDDPALASVREVLAHRTEADSPAVLSATAGAEAEVVGAFDAARLAGTASARQAFLARYPDHVLAREVAFFMPSEGHSG